MRSPVNVLILLTVLTLASGQYAFAKRHLEIPDSSNAEGLVALTNNRTQSTMTLLQFDRLLTMQHRMRNLLEEQNEESRFGIGYEARQRQSRGNPDRSTGDKNGATVNTDGNRDKGDTEGGSGSDGGGSGGGGSGGGGSGGGGSGGGGSGGGGSGGGGK